MITAGEKMMTTEQIDRAVIEQWLSAQVGIWPADSIAPDHLIKLLLNDVQHLPKHIGPETGEGVMPPERAGKPTHGALDRDERFERTERLAKILRKYAAAKLKEHDGGRPVYESDWVEKILEACVVPDPRITRIEALHRPDGGIGGPGAMCVECTPDFGTQYEEPVAWPCNTIRALSE
jgi:hypothetical protein